MLNISMSKFDEIIKNIMESMVVGGDASVLGPNAHGPHADGDARIAHGFGKIQRRDLRPKPRPRKNRQTKKGR
jgi:hypothetical protein